MKRLIAALLTFAMLVSLSACDRDKNNERPIVWNDENAVNTRGNSSGNINNNGIAAIQGNWIYYTKISDGLYKKRLDGTEKTQLSEDMCAFINVVGDWVYYSDGKTICKIRTDGTDKQSLNKDVSVGLIVVDEWIYYINKDDEWKIYRIKTDGTDNQLLNYAESEYINIVGDWLYYLATSNEELELCKMRLDGTEKTKILQADAAYVNVAGNWIYYSNENEEDFDNYIAPDEEGNDAPGEDMNIYRVGIDGSMKMQINEDYSLYVNVDGAWIYYSNDDDEGKIYKIHQDGSNKTKVCDDSGEYMNIVGEWIYYINFDERGNLYRIRTDGTMREKV